MLLLLRPSLHTQENTPPVLRFKPGSVTAAELRALADALRRRSPAAAHRHLPLLQLAEAAVAVIDGSQTGAVG
jgi:hypothetical protein